MDDLERAARAADINEKRRQLEPRCAAGDVEAVDQWLDLQREYAALFNLDVTPPPRERAFESEVSREQLLELKARWDEIDRLKRIRDANAG